MKIRNGFVSNSSSSSYIIAIKEIDSFAQVFIDKLGSEFLSYLRDDFDKCDNCEEGTWLYKLIKKCQEYENSSRWATVISCNVDYDAECMINYLDALEKAGLIKIISCE